MHYVLALTQSIDLYLVDVTPRQVVALCFLLAPPWITYGLRRLLQLRFVDVTQWILEQLLIFFLLLDDLGNLILPDIDVSLDSHCEVDPFVDVQHDREGEEHGAG